MKKLLVALNSKYIHLSLALWYLKQSCLTKGIETNVLELTINDNRDKIIMDIYEQKPDIILFSCYIWNIELFKKISIEIKKILPRLIIIMGGPEAGFDYKELLNEGFADYVINGEGEEVLIEVFKKIEKNEKINIEGVYTKENYINQKLYFNLINNLDTIPSPYTNEMLEASVNRILYYESSRGCPFSCAYCMSSTFQGVRYFPLDRVKSDIKMFIDKEIPLVKFVDRTFNANKERTIEIFKYIIENSINTCFHFEIAADLLDDNIIELLKLAKCGIIQFEVGVQTANELTLKTVSRTTDLDKILDNINKLKKINNIHLHLDLIAGLPFEDLQSFKKSFNFAMSMLPHNLQLGFLKLLKGSRIRKEAPEFSYKFKEYAPYEVMENTFINFDEIILLKGIEQVIDRYYNSGKFQNTFAFVFEKFNDNYFELFEKLSKFSKEKNRLYSMQSISNLYLNLFEFFVELKLENHEINILMQLLKLDYLSTDNSKNVPKFIERNLMNEFNEKCFDFLKDENNIKEYLPELMGEPAKKIIKNVHFESFTYSFIEGKIKMENGIYLFDYNSKNKVTGSYEYKFIKQVKFTKKII